MAATKGAAAPPRAAGKMAKQASPAAAPDAAPATAAGPLMTVVVRNEFYRDGFRNMLWIAIAEAVIVVVLVVTFIVYIKNAQPQDHYFATTADGRIMQLVPLDQQNMGTAALMSWVAQASTEVMTFGFHDYQRRLQHSSRHFTRHGWESFAAALQKSRIIESVEASQQVVTAQPSSAPILIQEGVFNGKYRWVIDLPLTVKFTSSAGTRTDNMMIRLVIDRVPSLENPNGVGIEQWIAA
jgi:intracellular multiplication protein IcmL